MKNASGFTLLELMIVLIIVGVLATLALVNYSSSIEKSRGAEARTVLGDLRRRCGGIYIDTGNTSGCGDSGFVPNAGVPGSAACSDSHWFWYSVSAQPPDGAVFTATRCVGASRIPPGKHENTLNLTVDYLSGSDSWDGYY